jgi:hypothetical protein
MNGFFCQLETFVMRNIFRQDRDIILLGRAYFLAVHIFPRFSDVY